MLSSIFTANRVAAIVSVLVALAAFVSALVGTFPKSWQNAALAIVAVIHTMVTVLKFLEGSQKYDQLTVTAHTVASEIEKHTRSGRAVQS